MPFKENYFCITVGLMIVFAVSLVLFAFDFEKELWFQPLKTCSIISFLGLSSYFFTQSMSEPLQIDSLYAIPEMTLNFGFALGILAFSSC
jgi:hypothetical protein